MTKTVNRSPESVFLSAMVSPTTPELPSTTQALTVDQISLSKSKVLLKKRDVPPTSDLPVKNNNEQCESSVKQQMLDKCRLDSRADKKKELAAELLQRHVQVWLLRRQEIERSNEVQKLRGELCRAAAAVIRDSYARYVKRRAIQSYMIQVENFESQLDNLLQRCLARKCQLEEVKHFATLRKQQRQIMDNHRRRQVCEWLNFRVRIRRRKKEQATTRAHKMLMGWIRRWALRKRCQARASAQETHRQQQELRWASSRRIAEFYCAAKLRHDTKHEVQRRRRIRHGCAKLQVAVSSIMLRNTVSCWEAWVCELKRVDEAVRKLQQHIRARQENSRHKRRISCCILLQRVFRGHATRLRCAQLRHYRHQEKLILRQFAAATVIQRHTRGFLTRQRLAEVVSKLRERFRCTNCGVVEPSGSYCKYCGRRRTTFKSLSDLIMLHERLQLEGMNQSAAPTSAAAVHKSSVGYPAPPSPITFPFKPQGAPHSLSKSFSRLRSKSSDGNGAFQAIKSLPAVSPPRHRRVVARTGMTIARSKSLTEPKLPQPRKNSVGEQTALRAAAIADSQSKYIASAQMHTLDMHITRLQRQNVAANRGSSLKLV